MFGYVRPLKSELLVREYEVYKGIYCTLCRQLGRSYGPPARLALNYDCTFYALLLLSLTRRGCDGFTLGRCVVNPLKHCLYSKGGKPEFEQASALTVLLLYYKLKDDIADTKNPKKLLYCLIYPAAALMRKHARKKFFALDEVVSACMDRQQKVECMEQPSLDICAEPTAVMMDQIMELSFTGSGQATPEQIRVLKQVGYFLGKWIYFIDAAEDMEDDILTGSFNPFVLKFQLDKSSPDTMLKTAKAYANQTLNMTLSQLNAACNLLDFNSMGSIIHNVVEKGLCGMQKKILFEKENAHV